MAPTRACLREKRAGSSHATSLAFAALPQSRRALGGCDAVGSVWRFLLGEVTAAPRSWAITGRARLPPTRRSPLDGGGWRAGAAGERGPRLAASHAGSAGRGQLWTGDDEAHLRSVCWNPALCRGHGTASARRTETRSGRSWGRGRGRTGSGAGPPEPPPLRCRRLSFLLALLLLQTLLLFPPQFSCCHHLGHRAAADSTFS